jgi:hypothetical protein
MKKFTLGGTRFPIFGMIAVTFLQSLAGFAADKVPVHIETKIITSNLGESYDIENSCKYHN